MIDHFKNHMIAEAYQASADHNAWVAYLVLLERFPNLTYWSWDGYHVHGLADYSADVVWRDNLIIRWSDKKEVAIVEDFYTASTNTITNTWVKMVHTNLFTEGWSHE